MQNLKMRSAATAGLYDLTMLEEMDDHEYVLEVLAALLHEMPGDFEEMQLALLAGNTDIVCKKAHKLKSSAGVIQAEKLTMLLGDIEAIGKKRGICDELISLVENAARESNHIEKSLKIYMEGLNKKIA
ncbi:MAG: Hpt domain-containing protein [Chitinophagaceae bacterium]|nr:Hpt domain-containing protein [Chitinophagaceae bacterium]